MFSQAKKYINIKICKNSWRIFLRLGFVRTIQSSFSCRTRQVCPIRYGFRAGVKAILSRVNIALIAFRLGIRSYRV